VDKELQYCTFQVLYTQVKWYLSNNENHFPVEIQYVCENVSYLQQKNKVHHNGHRVKKTRATAQRAKQF